MKKLSILFISISYVLLAACTTYYQEKAGTDGVAVIHPSTFLNGEKEFHAFIVGIDKEAVNKEDIKSRKELRITPGEHTVYVLCEYGNAVNSNNAIMLLGLLQGNFWNLLFLNDSSEARSAVTFTAKVNNTYSVNCQDSKYSWIEETATKTLIAESRDKSEVDNSE